MKATAKEWLKIAWCVNGWSVLSELIGCEEDKIKHIVEWLKVLKPNKKISLKRLRWYLGVK